MLWRKVANEYRDFTNNSIVAIFAMRSQTNSPSILILHGPKGNRYSTWKGVHETKIFRDDSGSVTLREWDHKIDGSKTWVKLVFWYYEAKPISSHNAF